MGTSNDEGKRGKDAYEHAEEGTENAAPHAGYRNTDAPSDKQCNYKTPVFHSCLLYENKYF